MREWYIKNKEYITVYILVFGVLVTAFAVLVTIVLTIISSRPPIWEIKVLSSSGDVLYKDKAIEIKEFGTNFEFIELRTGKVVIVVTEDRNDIIVTEIISGKK